MKKFMMFQVAWMLIVQIPASAWWAYHAIQVNISPVLFVLSLTYGVVILSIIPYLIRGIKPAWFN